MKRKLYNLLPSLLLLLAWPLLWSGCNGSQSSKGDEVVLHVLHTTDLHGSVFPYDFIKDAPMGGSYSRIATYVDSLRGVTSDVILLDAGDILQGQPTAYFYNFVDTLSEHLLASVLNYLKYDAVTVGNHDIEAGHRVYDTFADELNMPFMAANAIDNETGKPYFDPYTIIERGGKRVAVLGLLTPSIPDFLPNVLWDGMHFTDVVESAKQWLPEIQKESPDCIIALLHAGRGEKEKRDSMMEDAGYSLLAQVPEIDLVCAGHDHKVYVDSIIHPDGKKNYIVNPGAGGHRIADISLTFTDQGVRVSPSIVPLEEREPDEAFLNRFEKQRLDVKEFVSLPIGYTNETISSRPAFFGPSAFVDLIHQVQMSVYPEAQISLAAPLTLDTEVPKGPIAVKDLFKLYKYENMVNLMSFTGREIKMALEDSYSRWVNTMSVPTDDCLLFRAVDDGKSKFDRLQNPFFNFDAAYGIRYTVDVTKPAGERITITGLADGTLFDPLKEYKVVVNSYRGSGGGHILTDGIGLTHEELRGRILKATERDLRHYLSLYLEKHNPYTPKVLATWKFVPESLVKPALQRDSLRLFNEE